MNKSVRHMETDLRKLYRTLERRSGGNIVFSFRMRIWNITVKMSYTVKRWFDVVLALLGLFCLIPLFIVIAVAVKLSSPGPIIFSQIRVGRYGRYFCFYKFRTMYVDAEQRRKELLAQNQSSDGVIFKIKKDPRITSVGRILRKLSLDELPQLLNVLLGDMSLVGPRPPLPHEVALYTLEERKRLNVIPGLTCLWQISGRSDVPFKQQVKLDHEYIISRSLWRDLWILLRTIPAIISGRGAY